MKQLSPYLKSQLIWEHIFPFIVLNTIGIGFIVPLSISWFRDLGYNWAGTLFGTILVWLLLNNYALSAHGLTSLYLAAIIATPKAMLQIQFIPIVDIILALITQLLKKIILVLLASDNSSHKYSLHNYPQVNPTLIADTPYKLFPISCTLLN